MNDNSRTTMERRTIGLDASALRPGFKAHFGRGIGRYVSELHKFLFSAAGRAAATELGLLVQPFDQPTLFDESDIGRVLGHLPVLRQTVRQQVVLPRLLSHFDFIHFPAHMDAPAWGTHRTVVTVLDLIPLVLGDLYRAAKGNMRYRFARYLECEAIRRATLILAISEHTARDVERILKVDPARIVVTPLGVDQHFFEPPETSDVRRVRERYELKEVPPVVYVGGIDPRKNVPVLIQGFRAFLDLLPPAEPKPELLLVGKIQADDQYPGLMKLIEELSLGDLVRPVGYVSDADLPALYRQSGAFFFPSLYEGFGLPPLEAAACGVPVVCARTSCLPEVRGEVALFFDAQSAREAGAALQALYTQPERRRELANKGPSQAAKFTWEATGRKTLEGYRRAQELAERESTGRSLPFAA